jgi:hypothetical protein
MNFEFENTLTVGLESIFKKINMDGNSGIDFEARKKVALQLLNNCVRGSKNCPVTPPIKDGILRASASVFVNGQLIGTSESEGQNGTPCTDYTETNDITIGYNTAYAARIHENLEPAGTFKLGEQSIKAGNVEGKWLEQHLQADGEDLAGFYADLIRNELDK